MHINQQCIGCRQCWPVCPVGAIGATADGHHSEVNLDRCVECSACLRSRVCPVNAFEPQELPWPRSLRSAFSDVLSPHKSTGVLGRGTEEMKTNDVTGRLRAGFVNVAVELGRPGISASFEDVQKVTRALARLDVEFQKENPVTSLFTSDRNGDLNPEVLGERVLSALVKFEIPVSRVPELVEALEEAGKTVDTVFSAALAEPIRPGESEPELIQILEENGIFLSSQRKNQCRTWQTVSSSGGGIMTHTLHRRGSKSDLAHDYVVLAMAARGVKRDGAAPKLAQALEIFAAHNPVNYGNVAGNSFTRTLPEMVSLTRDNTVSHAVFRDIEDVTAVLQDLKKEDLGISIVVSGLFDQVKASCRCAGLTPHTANVSLGIFGKTDKLPKEGVLEIASMCGHNMVSFGVIKKLVRDIEDGFTTPEQAAKKIAASCLCGVFNWERAAQVFSRLAEGAQA